MSGESLQDFNRKRKKGYYKDEGTEKYLHHINAVLQKDERKSYRDLPEEHATLFVFGLPRSGTTFMAQLIAHAFDIGYINNFMARFWLAPVTGIRLSGIILGSEPAVNFESHYATTSRLDDLHEFGYFWRHWLKKNNIGEILRSGELEREIDWEGLKKTVCNIHAAFGNSWICKNIFGAYHLTKLSQVFSRSFFVYIERDPLDVAVSIMDARRKFYGDTSLWWSTIPLEYPRLKGLPADEQVAGQVWYLRKFYRQELEKMSPDRVIRISYPEATGDPQQTVERIRKQVRDITGTELKQKPGLPEKFHVRTHGHRRQERERFARLMEKFEG